MLTCRRRLTAAVVLAGVMLAGCATGGDVRLVAGAPPHPAATGSVSPTTSPTPATVLVAGRSVPIAQAGTVAAALHTAGVAVPAGRLLAVVSRRPLRGDGIAGRVFVNGQPATLAGVLRVGDVISVVAGADRVEPTHTVTVAVPAPNPGGLYVGGTAGSARVVVGTESGEEVSRTVLTTPTLGRLRAPGTVALTFDDGPDPAWTPQVLRLLADAGVHATFCLIGEQAAAHPDLVRAIVAGGHTLCDHTWDHDQKLPTRSASIIRDEIARAYTAITTASGGTVPVFFRAPGGAWSPAVEAEARRQHLVALRWTVDPRDWSRPGVQQILATVYAELRPGGIVLLHDGGGDRAQTLAALRALLAELPRLGYRFTLPPAR